MSGNVWVAWPLACLGGGALVLAVVARLWRHLLAHWSAIHNGILSLLTTLVFGIALVVSLPLLLLASNGDPAGPAWSLGGLGSPSLRADPGASAIIAIALGLGALVAFYSGRYLSLDRRYDTYYPLLLLLVGGITGMVLAADLFNLYMFCELMSVAAYALVAFRRRTDTAIEAGFKYLIMGSVGTLIVLMGISFLYRARGHLNLLPASVVPGVRAGHSPAGAPEIWERAGIACFLVGMGIKSAFIPFHTWLPDAHGRAPSSIGAMLSGIVIQSAFYALLKVCLGLGLAARSLGTLLIVLALLNMTLGNGLALVQTHTKRLLAYSTIAQMGYVMFSIGLGLRYRMATAIQAGFFLLLAHAVMKSLAFLCKGVCHYYCDAFTVDDLRGMVQKLPLTALSFAVALGGLAGVPPLVGFASKWFIVTRALRGEDVLVYVGLGVFLLNGLLALGYYLPLIGTLFASAPAARMGAGNGRIRISVWMAVPLTLLSGLVVAMGAYPGPWFEWMAGVGVFLLGQ